MDRPGRSFALLASVSLTHGCGGIAIGDASQAGDAGIERSTFEEDVKAAAEAAPEAGGGGDCRLLDGGSATEVRSCVAAGPCSLPMDNCRIASLQRTLVAFAAECGAYGGRLEAQFQAGCATSVDLSSLCVLSPHTGSGAASCIRDHILGGLWDCAPADGRVEANIGSCTIQ